MTKHPYAAFGRYLRQAMDSAHMGVKETAAMARVHKTTLSSYRTGSVLPNAATVARLASALDAPFLVKLARKSMTRDCARCGTSFVSVHAVMRFCTSRCRRRHNGDVEKTRRPTPADRLRVQARLIPWLETEIARLVSEVAARDDDFAAFCMSCEPEGACRTPDCLIQVQGRSPLPLAEDRLRIA